MKHCSIMGLKKVTKIFEKLAHDYIIYMMLECNLEFSFACKCLQDCTYIFTLTKNPWSSSRPTGYLSSAAIVSVCQLDCEPENIIYISPVT